MKVSKLLVTIGAAIAMTFTLTALTGCNADEANEKVIRESLTEQFDAFKNHDSSIVSQIRQQNAVDLATMGIDGEEYANAILEGFDYSIEEVDVDGDKATVTLILTQKDLDEDEFEAMTDEIAEDPAIVGMSTTELKQLFSDKLFEYIESIPATPQDPVTLHLELKNKIWDLTDESAMRVKTLFTF